MYFIYISTIIIIITAAAATYYSVIDFSLSAFKTCQPSDSFS